ncbi:MAG: hypothetical protein A3H98_00150 [Bacteroidetes bacterium RIFCSPLOWO2_02_FULL_36_8]|nr:MAG: hypothetical protein A3H98_00150 [Bacteroidetes bacterium RIFCSPLOWO2_02_FULL_36_8]OFY71033.1 MAG: hypothetical protein A3G23_12060 [Bacteroidetes bacterium RIFCSPLOWO2_12_FULL_37_12]
MSEKLTFFNNKIVALVPLAFILCFSSCKNNKEQPGYEYMPDMVYSRSFEYYSANPLDKSKSMAKVPPVGSIPRSFTPYPYPNTKDGYEQAGKEWINPLSSNDIYIDEGKKLFELYCVYCHGQKGEANGILVEKQKFPPPPSFSSDILKELPAGKIFHSITYGKNLMGPHASMLSYQERCKVVLFVQSLQKKL